MTRPNSAIAILSLLTLALTGASCELGPRTPDPGPLPAPNRSAARPLAVEPEPVFEKLLPPPPPVAPAPVAALPSPGALSSELARPTSTGTGKLEYIALDEDPELAAPASRSRRKSSAEAVESPAPEAMRAADHRELVELVRRIERGQTLGDADSLRLIELKKRLISRLFQGDRQDLGFFSTLVDALEVGGRSTLSLDLLEAAFFEELGLTSRRDEKLEALGRRWRAAIGEDGFRIVRYAAVSHYSGYRKVTRLETPVRLSPGGSLALYGEMENFRNTPVGTAGSRRYRRAFSAHLCLRERDGDALHRTPFLTAGTPGSEELAGKPDQPVHFYGQYRVPTGVRPGVHDLELVVTDLEGETRAEASIELIVE